MLGIANDKADLNSWLGEKNAWSYYSLYGYKYYDGSQLPAGKGIPSGSIVSVQVSIADGSIEFFLNGKSMGRDKIKIKER